MGGDQYSFMALWSSGCAILVLNKDIKEAYRQGSSNKDVDANNVEDTRSTMSDDDKDVLDDPLDEEETEWLLNHAKGFNAYQIGNSFVLVMKVPHNLQEAPPLNVWGPRDPEETFFVKFGIKEASKGEEYTELVEVARKLTPSGSKLSFAPGVYTFSTTYSSIMEVRHLNGSDLFSDSATEKASTDDDDDKKTNDHLQQEIPTDFELIIGKGNKKKTIRVGRAILFCYFPHLETLVNDALKDTKLELPQLDPEAVQKVLDALTSRKKVRLYGHSTSQVTDAFGWSTIDSDDDVDKDEPPTKKCKKEHPAMADPRWLDVTFLVGPDKEEIKVNRLVLASMNPVLHRVLFGTGLILVDPSKPIEWPDFDGQAVRLVFLALIHCGKKELVVPMEKVEAVKMVVDYLMETRKDLFLYYDTPFKRTLYDHGGKYVLVPGGEDGQGLEFTDCYSYDE
jgi:hypothetical protein